MVTIKTKEEIKILRESGKILHKTLMILKDMVVPGMTTKKLEEKALELLLENNAKGAFLNYSGYPSVLCASVNDVIVHELPSDKPLKEGDILSLDFGVDYGGLITDSAITVAVGSVSEEIKKLINVTERSLKIGIKEVRAGATTGDIGHAIQKYVEKEGFSVIRELVGHGVGYAVHEEPSVPNYGRAGDGETLKEGMVIAIEPMVSMGDWRIERSADRFGYRTKDGSLSAHFEHTVAVTKGGCEILTI
jgi:methionyl aminopeptidase